MSRVLEALSGRRKPKPSKPKIVYVQQRWFESREAKDIYNTRERLRRRAVRRAKGIGQKKKNPTRPHIISLDAYPGWEENVQDKPLTPAQILDIKELYYGQ